MKKYKILSDEQLKNILKEHRKWIESNGEKGSRADLTDVDLRGNSLPLSGADLREAWLDGANLKGVDLKRALLAGARAVKANFRHAFLRGASLSNGTFTASNFIEADLAAADLRDAGLDEAKLANANLYKSNLSGATLNEADLKGASMTMACLTDADLYEAKNLPPLPQCDVCPSHGSFIGWKKLNSGSIAELRIPSGALRSSATTRKCRCSYARVLAIYDFFGHKIKEELSTRGLLYVTGKIVKPDSFDKNRWAECSNGIHFFITKQEAINYTL